MIYKIIPLLIFGFFSFTTSPSISNKPVIVISKLVEATSNNDLDSKAETLYNNLNANNFILPRKESFIEALNGFYKFKSEQVIQKNILTLVDFSYSSKEKRLWVIDIENNIILFQSFVAHGQNSGVEYATQFSNKPESHKSSLGFYATGETYYGKHGYSLRLDGLEKGVNSNARGRAIVIHGAKYVSENFIEHNGRLGRSYGCPSLPTEISGKIIDTIKNKSCLFVYYSSKTDKT